MPDKVVELKTGRRETDQVPDPRFWFGPLDARISQIERIIAKLEWQIWIILCGVSALVLLAILEQTAAA